MTGAILIVEDDEDISNLIDVYMKREGFATRPVASGEEAVAALRASRWDLVLLDINLPGMDGFEVLREVRSASSVPVIIISARQEEMDAVFGLGAGADEYVTKPFSPRVLVARVRALLRRTATGEDPDTRSGAAQEAGPQAADPDSEAPVVFGAVEVYLETARVFREGAEVQLAPREFGVLRYLIERRGRPATPEEIYQGVWENDYGDVSSVAVHIQRLRRKLEPEPSKPRFITTRHGYGYALDLGIRREE